jgi:hypothetical protein
MAEAQTALEYVCDQLNLWAGGVTPTSPGHMQSVSKLAVTILDEMDREGTHWKRQAEHAVANANERLEDVRTLKEYVKKALEEVSFRTDVNESMWKLVDIYKVEAMSKSNDWLFSFLAGVITDCVMVAILAKIVLAQEVGQ